MIPNEQKRIFNQDKKPFSKTPEPIIDLQIFQPQKPKQPPAGNPNPAVFYPNYVPNPFNPMAYANYQQSFFGGQQQPIFKEYTININGVSGSHIKTAMLMEDALPTSNIQNTNTTLSERNVLYEYIRSIIFSNRDGQDVPIEDDSKNLLSRIKFMDLNPYNSNRFSNNPYKGLPYGFLLFRSCYPIRHDSRLASVMCADQSTGLNVRIYRMTEGSYLIGRHTGKQSDYDEWRDIAFYNFVRDNILKKKMCPNFPYMYGYNITLNSAINFDELLLIQDPHRERDLINISKNITANRHQTLRNMHSQQQAMRNMNRQAQSQQQPQQPQPQPQQPQQPQPQLRTMTNMPSQQLIQQRMMQQQLNIQANKFQTNLTSYNGKVLVCLTEAMNYSIIGWAKMEYRADGNVKRMINSGFHTMNIWKSVYLQLLAALYCMQLNKIWINDFTMDRNVFIRDINSGAGGTSTSYWKYIIDGVEYYVPNYGYLVKIDTNFRDFDNLVLGDKETDIKRERKIDGVCLECGLKPEEMDDKIFKMLLIASDMNCYSQDFINTGGVKPPEEIIRLMGELRTDALQKKNMNFGYYIRKYFGSFTNNRVGGLLDEQEVKHIKGGAVKEFRKGQIVVMNDTNGIKRFVIHLETNGMVARIMTRDDIKTDSSNIIEKEVPVSSLNEYSLVEPVVQTFKVNSARLNEEDILETYTMGHYK